MSLKREFPYISNGMKLPVSLHNQINSNYIIKYVPL